MLCSDWLYLSKGPRSSAGAEEAAEATGSAILPAVRTSPDTGQRATDLTQSIRGWNIRLPEVLCHVLPPSSLTLRNKQKEKRKI